MMNYTEKDHTFAVCAYKESEYLEECIKSLLSQSVKSNIFISTSTPNGYIKSIAEKYGLETVVNTGKTGIGMDWNFAYDTACTPLVTIAHQDDIYEKDYTKEMLEYINGAKNPIIYFTGYAEIRNGEKIFSNTLLNVKKLMLCPLKIKAFSSVKPVKRAVMAFGNSICCPSVTFVKKAVGGSPFTDKYKSNVDWEQWEMLSHKKGDFVYNSKPLMCHRVHDGSTTSALINDNSRTKEDYEMYLKFWHKPMASLLVKAYSKSQESNNVKGEKE